MKTENWIDLTLNVSVACAIRGQVLPMVHRIQEMRATTSIQDWISFSFGSTTHMDLPWSMDWDTVSKLVADNPELFPEDMVKNKDYFRNVKSKTMRARSDKKYFKPFESPCSVFNCTDKIDIIGKYLESPSPYSHFSFNLSPKIDEYEFENLLHEIEITKPWIQNIERQNGIDLSEKFIIFRTGWSNKFYCARTDLSNPIFEGWHAYLIHPYLSDDAILYLVSKNVKGVGVDSPGLENPLSYVNSFSDRYQPYLRRLVATRKRLAPLHFIFLAQERLLIENLVNLDVEELDSRLPINGTIRIFPYEMGSECVCPVKIYFEMEGA
ncbi:MAG: cyclase family protein [archaeon]|nr:cyclase family protein [archaeon]MCP8314943.1 cyclase family protein [archaeon]